MFLVHTVCHIAEFPLENLYIHELYYQNSTVLTCCTIPAQTRHSVVTCRSRGKRAARCRLAHLTQHASLHSASFQFCAGTSNCWRQWKQKRTVLIVGIVLITRGSKTWWVPRTNENYLLRCCCFDSSCGPLRAQANEAAKSQITCFPAQTRSLWGGWRSNLGLEGSAD